MAASSLPGCRPGPLAAFQGLALGRFLGRGVRRQTAHKTFVKYMDAKIQVRKLFFEMIRLQKLVFEMISLDEKLFSEVISRDRKKVSEIRMNQTDILADEEFDVKDKTLAQ